MDRAEARASLPPDLRAAVDILHPSVRDQLLDFLRSPECQRYLAEGRELSASMAEAWSDHAHRVFYTTLLAIQERGDWR